MLGSFCTEMHHPALKLKGDTLRIFCNCQEVTTQRPFLRNPMFIKNFQFYFGVDLYSVGFAVHFLFTLYNVFHKSTCHHHKARLCQA
jgi:hypothetical protein